MNQSNALTQASTEDKIYTGTAARILKLLGTGCTAVEASRACGVVESYVSQLKAEPSFVKQLNEIVRKTMESQSKIDENYSEIERIASERLLQAVQYVFDPDKSLRIAKFANEAKRKFAAPAREEGSGSSGPGTGESRTVILILPTQVAKEFVLNPMGEVVGVDGKELTTLPSKNITGLVEKHKKLEKEIKQGFKIRDDSVARQTDPYSDL